MNGTCISAIAANQLRPSRAASGYTGVYLDRKIGRWQAYINFQKKRYYLGSYRELQTAVSARKKAEERLHTPAIQEYWDTLSHSRQQEYLRYLEASER